MIIVWYIRVNGDIFLGLRSDVVVDRGLVDLLLLCGVIAVLLVITILRIPIISGKNLN